MIQQTEVDTEMGESETIIDSPLQAQRSEAQSTQVFHICVWIFCARFIVKSTCHQLTELTQFILNPLKESNSMGLHVWLDINLEIQRLDNVIQFSDAHDAFRVLAKLCNTITFDGLCILHKGATETGPPDGESQQLCTAGLCCEHWRSPGYNLWFSILHGGGRSFGELLTRNSKKVAEASI